MTVAGDASTWTRDCSGRIFSDFGAQAVSPGWRRSLVGSGLQRRAFARMGARPKPPLHRRWRRRRPGRELALAAKLENEATESAATGAPAGDAPASAETLAATLPTVERPRELTMARVMLDLRPVGPAEMRAAGRLVRIDCGEKTVALAFHTESNELRIAGPVLITYGLLPDLNMAGEVSAVEFVPDGYRPPGQ